MKVRLWLFGIFAMMAIASGVISFVNYYNASQNVKAFEQRAMNIFATKQELEKFATKEEINSCFSELNLIRKEYEQLKKALISSEQAVNPVRKVENLIRPNRDYSTERWKVLQKARINLSSSDADTRKKAVHIIEDLEGKELIEDLFKQSLKEKDSDVLSLLLALIGEWGDETMVPLLTEIKYENYAEKNYNMFSEIRRAIENIQARVKPNRK